MPPVKPKKQRLSKIKESRQRALRQIEDYKKQTGSVPKIVSTFPRPQLPYDKAIRKIGGKRRINIEVLIDALASNDIILQKTALNRLLTDKRLLQLLKNPKYAKLLPKISLLLDNRNQKIRDIAINALGHIQTKKSLQILSALINYTGWEIQKKAIQSLGNFQTKESFQLLSQLAKDKNEYIRQAVAKSLGNFQTKESLQLLSQLAKDKNESVRYAVAKSLGNFKTKESFQLLSQLAKDKNESVKSAVVRSLGNFRTKESFQFFSSLANNREGEVSISVIEALGKINTKESFQLLSQIANRKKILKITVAESLGNIKTKKSFQLLSQLANDRDLDVRTAVARSLGNFQTKESLQLLSKLAKDSDWVVKEAADRALRKFKPKETLYPLNQRKPFATTPHLPEILKKAKVLEEISKKLKQKHKDKFIGIVIFGSIAKGYSTPNSDVDYTIIGTNREILYDFEVLAGKKLLLDHDRYVDPNKQTLFEPFFYGLFFGDRKLLKQAQKKVFEKNFLNNPKKWEELRRKILWYETDLKKTFERVKSSLSDKQRAYVAASLRTPPPYNEMLKLLKIKSKQ